MIQNIWHCFACTGTKTTANCLTFWIFKNFNWQGYFQYLVTFLLCSISTQVYYYFSCSASNDVLAWISAMILFALGILYLILHFAVGKEGYAGELKG